MFSLYRQLSTRAIVRGTTPDVEEAVAYLENNKRYAFVQDENGNIYKTKEELKDAKNLRSKAESWGDHFYTSGSAVPKDTDRELPETDRNNSESGSECDN